MDEQFKEVEESELKSSSGSSGSSSGNRSQTLVPLRELAPGQLVVNRYKILNQIGRGAMGYVYEVEQVFLKKRFAMKTLSAASESPVALRRFLQEAQAASELEHPNLVRAIDCGLIEDEQPFLVMELLKGRNLKRHLSKVGRLSTEATIQILAPICSALAYAHERGIIHRDIKPSNIVLVPSESDPAVFIPKIVDFGIAKLEFAQQHETLTRAGEVFGTPLYMSPEQCLGSNVDNRSDIYSLGCVLFELLTGAPPFAGQTALETMMRHRTEGAPTLRDASLGLEFPPSLEKIVAKMLAKEPGERYQTCTDVMRDLDAVHHGSASGLKAGIASKESASKSKLSKAVTAIVAGTILCIICGAAFWLWSNSKPVVSASGTPSKQKMDTGSSTFAVPDSSLGIKSTDDGAFSTVKDGQRTFCFPKTGMGRISWWNNEPKPHIVPASGNVSIPINAKATLLLEGPIFVGNRGLLGRLADDRLSGIMIRNSKDLRSIIDEEMVTKPLMYLKMCDSVRLVCFIYVPVSTASLQVIGKMPALHWLVLNDAEVTGEQASKLENLRNLRVLSVDRIKHVSPLLKQLEHGKELKRLSLEEVKLTESDARSLSTLSSLTDLNLLLSFDAVQPSQSKLIFSDLSKLSKLERLALERRTFSREGAPLPLFALESLKKMKRLKALYVNSMPDAETTLVKKYLPPNCKLIYPCMTDYVEAWFNPECENPAARDLW